MKQLYLLTLLALVFSTLTAQDLPLALNEYKFTVVKKSGATPVENQNKSGTCWVYSANSFFESELLRMGKQPADLSEMYVVRAGYLERARNYVRRQGAAAFGQGAETHDVLQLVRKHGIVPESVYSGFPSGQDKPVHGEMEAVLKAITEAVIKMPDGKLSDQWFKAYTGALDGYMGAPPAKFSVGEKEFTPQTYFQSLGINLDDYVPLTSYAHHPFYKPFILEVSDNWSNGIFYNVPIDELVQIADNAVDRGFSIVWATDISEKTFSAKEGLAVWPEKSWADMSAEERNAWAKAPVKEKVVGQDERQQGFDELTTTDDHGMHITGVVTDQNGTRYYIVKNSWGTVHEQMGGYIYVSQPYFRCKTMSMLVHKDAIPAALRKKLGL
ncbi:MAG: aminopeptidase [Saprospirales bacterium]|jgi:bleomycin hydrolase|nr:aminopeptidase [Saprospirales bacterium]MBK8921746.1 aminopeptidase [Saprospirales bacterium]